MIGEVRQPLIEPACRKFSLSDAMILIGAASLMLSLEQDRWLTLGKDVWLGRLPLHDLLVLGRPLRPARSHELLFAWLAANELLHATLFWLTPAVLMLRLRRPRPRLLALLRQPGSVACLAASSGVWGYYVVWWAATGPYPQPLVAGAAVMVAWVALGLGRVLRCEAGWIDGLGRSVGVGWVLLGLGQAWQSTWYL